MLNDIKIRAWIIGIFLIYNLFSMGFAWRTGYKQAQNKVIRESLESIQNDLKIQRNRMAALDNLAEEYSRQNQVIMSSNRHLEALKEHVERIDLKLPCFDARVVSLFNDTLRPGNSDDAN